MRRRAGFLLAASCMLGACETGPSPEELLASDAAACSAAGFEPGSDAERLCRLLQETNRRLDGLERRLGFLELDVRSWRGFGRCGIGSC